MKLLEVDSKDFSNRLRQCCSCEAWVAGVMQAYPFVSSDALFRVADDVWQSLAEPDYLEAFSGHPKIGDVSSLRQKYESTRQLASAEQSGVAAASEATLQELAQLNADYEARFGFIFIVCATGKSADEMLGILKSRIGHDRQAEIGIAAAEQQKIFHLRLNQQMSLEEDP